MSPCYPTRSSRSGPGQSLAIRRLVPCRSQRGRVSHDPPPLVPEDGGAGGVEREAWSVEDSGQQSVKPKAGSWR